jgi:uncharacterized membrane protein HdeD (DUF308 family)
MSTNPDNPNYELEATVQKNLGWLIVLSILLILLGLFAIFRPGVATVSFTLVLGWILFFSGIIRIVKAFQSRPVRGFWLNLVIGILYVVAGLLVIFNPLAGVLTLTALLGILFIVEGIYDIISAFQTRPGGKFSWLVLLDGIVTLILGILVWNQWPYSAIWLVGLYVGISILFSGIALLTIALGTRNALKNATV